MIDRDNTVFAVRGLKFPSRKNLDESLRDTLVDGVRHCSHCLQLIISSVYLNDLISSTEAP